MGFIGTLFDLLLIDPITNLFVLLSGVSGSAGIGVILLTIFIRFVTLPLTLRQMHQTRLMAAMAPRMQEVQKRYKDPRRRSEEQMKLYREAGLNPLGCFSSMILQFPILIALYRVFTIAVGESPESMIKVASRLYAWDPLRNAMPLQADFLWFHLGRPDPLFILPMAVAATTYVMQKMTVMPAATEQQRAQNAMMNLMMPLLFGWITLSLPSGLGLYYVLSNVIGMVLQYAYIGGGPFNWKGLLGLNQDPILPRALEVRAAQIERAKNFGRSEDDYEEPDAEPAKPGKTPPAGGNGGARRRRYASGRRRSRR